MPLHAIDPSLALGFYCRGRGEFYLFFYTIELTMHVMLTKSTGVQIMLLIVIAAEFVDLCARASELARESSGAPMFTVVENNNSRIDPFPAEIGTPPEQGPSEEDWQIL